MASTALLLVVMVVVQTEDTELLVTLPVEEAVVSLVSSQAIPRKAALQLSLLDLAEAVDTDKAVLAEAKLETTEALVVKEEAKMQAALEHKVLTEVT